MGNADDCYFNSEGYRDPTTYEAFKNIDRQVRAEGRNPEYRPIVFICSPYAGDVERNTENALRYCRMAYERGYLPIAPHLFFPRFLSDGDPGEREDGLFMGRVLLTKCSEIWVFGGTISNGMAKELEKAEARKMPTRHFTETCEEVR